MAGTWLAGNGRSSVVLLLKDFGGLAEVSGSAPGHRERPQHQGQQVPAGRRRCVARAPTVCRSRCSTRRAHCGLELSPRQGPVADPAPSGEHAAVSASSAWPTRQAAPPRFAKATKSIAADAPSRGTATAGRRSTDRTPPDATTSTYLPVTPPNISYALVWRPVAPANASRERTGKKPLVSRTILC